MNGIGIIYDRDGNPAVLTMALQLINDDRVQALVNQLLEQLGWHPMGSNNGSQEMQRPLN